MKGLAGTTLGLAVLALAGSLSGDIIPWKAPSGEMPSNWVPPDPNDIPNSRCRCPIDPPANAGGCYIAYRCAPYADLGGAVSAIGKNVIDKIGTFTCVSQPCHWTYCKKPIRVRWWDQAFVDWGYPFDTQTRAAINGFLVARVGISTTPRFDAGEIPYTYMEWEDAPERGAGWMPPCSRPSTHWAEVEWRPVASRLPLRYQWYYQIRCPGQQWVWVAYQECTNTLYGWATLDGVDGLGSKGCNSSAPKEWNVACWCGDFEWSTW